MSLKIAPIESLRIWLDRTRTYGPRSRYTHSGKHGLVENMAGWPIVENKTRVVEKKITIVENKNTIVEKKSP